MGLEPKGLCCKWDLAFAIIDQKMGCCEGKATGGQLELRNQDHFDSETSRKLSEATQLSTSFQHVPTDSNISRLSSKICKPQQHQQSQQRGHNSPKEPLLPAANAVMVDELSENKLQTLNSQKREVSYSPAGPHDANSSALHKPVKVHRMPNGAQLRIRFGPLSMIDEEESQRGLTQVQSEASRKDYNNIEMSNWANQ